MSIRHKFLRAAGPLVIGGLTAVLPLVQGGMGVGVSMAGLASAVANEGGVGVISAALIASTPRYREMKLKDEDALKLEIKRAKSMSDGVIGVNIMVAMTRFEKLVKAACEAQADIIFAGAGLPLDLPGLVPEGSQTRLVPIVSSARAARLITSRWMSRHNRLPDAFVLEGPKAGGHLGFKLEQIEDENFRLEALIPPMRKALDELAEETGHRIPLIAAGGIFDGADIARCLALGADAVQMGTRFVATQECDASHAFKQAYVDVTEEDIVLTQSPVGLPGRALSNRFTRAVALGQHSPIRCRYHCISSCARENSVYCIAGALLTSLEGDEQEGLVFAGANAYRVDRILTVGELITSLDLELGQAQGHSAPQERSQPS